MIIGINYTGGFSAVSSKKEMENIIQKTQRVIAGIYPSVGDAYVALINENADRNIAAGTVPVAPRYEEFRNLPFFIHPNKKFATQTAERIFVLWDLKCCGIYTDMGLAINDFMYMGSLVLIEVSNEMEAVKIINTKYKKVIYPLLPVITEKVPFLSGPIQQNILHKMPYADILNDLNLQKDIRALNPYLGQEETGRELNASLTDVISVDG